MSTAQDSLDSDDDSFAFGLSFAATPCPACSEIAGLPVCPECGTPVPMPEALNQATAVRREVLLPMRDAAEAALIGFDALPPPRVPITSRTMLSGLVEADLFDQLTQVFGFGHDLGAVDLDDPAVIRGTVAQLARQHVDALLSALKACRELSVFLSPPPGDGIAALAADTGRKAGRTLIAYLAALTAIDYAAAQDAHRAIQRELDAFEPAEAFSALLDALRDTETTLDDRVGRALARAGVYTDAWGNLDVGRVFWAFREDGDPFLAVGRRAAQYFAPLLPVGLDAADNHAAALLALPLLQIVGVNRPLIAHRLARETYDLLHAAADVDKAAVEAIVERTAADGGLVLGLQGDADLLLKNTIDSHDEVASLVAAYQRLARLWAAYARLLLSLAGIPSRTDDGSRAHGPPADDDILAVRERLLGCDAPALQTLADILEADLCSDPAGYTWDEVNDRLIHSRFARVWTLEAFEREIDGMVSAIAGIDAGYCLGIVADTLASDTPSWLEGLGGGYAAEVLARCVFGAAGAEVLFVTSDGSRTTVAPLGDDLDAIRLLAAAAGLGAVFNETAQFEVVSRDGDNIIAISANALRDAREAPEVLNDLATVSAFRESLVARDGAPDEAEITLAACHAVLIGALGRRSLALDVDRAEVHRTIAERADYAMTSLRGKPITNKVMRRHVERLGRLRAASAAARRGDAGADRRALDQLTSLADWGRSRGGTALPL